MIPVIDALLGIAKEGLALIPDVNKRAQMETDLEHARLDYESKFMQAQADIDKVEAQNQNLFISGWRPFLGWVCGFAFSWVYVLAPALSFVLNAAGHPVSLPTVDFSTMSTVLFGMLGLGTLRTVEKIQGVASK